MNVKEAFDITKLTENGDLSYKKVSGNEMLNILFMTEYYTKHLDEVPIIGDSEREKLFARFIRDPRYGLGRRDLGRTLMGMTGCSIDEIVKSGRIDDLFMCSGIGFGIGFVELCDYLYKEISNGNELVKKWMPRYSSKNVDSARIFAKFWNMNKQQYGKFIKCDTTENKLSRKRTDEIEFDKIPSLCLLKYYNRFATKSDTSERFNKFIEDVKAGKKEIHVSTTNVYDIYRNREKIDPDLFFNKIEKVPMNILPIVDTSGSMHNSNDAFGKAMSIGHYLAKCSTYLPNTVVTFSSTPKLIELGDFSVKTNYMRSKLRWLGDDYTPETHFSSEYEKEISSMDIGDFSNTDFAKVMELLKNVDNLPEYLVVLTDMEFDHGSYQSKTEVEHLWKEKGYTTKIIWWNLNERNTTCPEMDSSGNIFMSGYSPYLLKYLENGFDGEMFLNKLIDEYAEKINK